ncbi:TPA: hypothetical protein DCX15_00975 [bacterium]|nr:hypothetical protein [bacterium]
MAELGSGLGSSYPSAYDTDSLKEVNYPIAGFTYARAEVPNDLADAVVKIQGAVGLTPQGVLTTLSERLNVSFESDGGLKPNTVGDSQVNAAFPIIRQKIDFVGFYVTKVLSNPIEILTASDQSSIPWTAFSVSSWVSPLAKAVQLHTSIMDTGAGQAVFKVRRFGNTEEDAVLKVRTQVPGKWIDVAGDIHLGADQKVEYKLSATGTSTASIRMLMMSVYE